MGRGGGGGGADACARGYRRANCMACMRQDAARPRRCDCAVITHTALPDSFLSSNQRNGAAARTTLIPPTARPGHFVSIPTQTAQASGPAAVEWYCTQSLAPILPAALLRKHTRRQQSTTLARWQQHMIEPLPPVSSLSSSPKGTTRAHLPRCRSLHVATLCCEGVRSGIGFGRAQRVRRWAPLLLLLRTPWPWEYPGCLCAAGVWSRADEHRHAIRSSLRSCVCVCATHGACLYACTCFFGGGVGCGGVAVYKGGGARGRGERTRTRRGIPRRAGRPTHTLFLYGIPLSHVPAHPGVQAPPLRRWSGYHGNGQACDAHAAQDCLSVHGACH